MNLVKYIIPDIHKEGYLFIALFFLATMLIFNFSQVFGWIGVILTIWCVFFFRDPQRVTPNDANLVISPADGVVSKIEEAVPPEELELGNEKMIRISVFLSVFNVHVNRVPTNGKIEKLYYHPGKFLNASLDKASKDNERQTILMSTDSGDKIIFTQIAGLVARRIVCDLEEGDKVKAGERFGIIRFGSRMDVYLPKNVNPLVVEGQTAIAGETIFADLKSKQMARIGEIR